MIVFLEPWIRAREPIAIREPVPIPSLRAFLVLFAAATVRVVPLERAVCPILIVQPLILIPAATRHAKLVYASITH